MACPSSTQPSNTAVTGLSKPSDDTATDGNRAMPRHHNNQPWRALLHNPAVSSSSLVQLTLPRLALIDRAVALMARSNSPTLGHPKFPQAGPPDYDDSGATAMRAAASLRR